MSLTSKDYNSLRSRFFSVIIFKPFDNKDFTINESILSNNFVNYVFICHDRDVNDDGELKPIHWHIIIQCISRHSPTKIIKLFSSLFSIPEILITCSIVRHLIPATRYLCHLDDSDKFQYKFKELTTNNFGWVMSNLVADEMVYTNFIISELKKADYKLERLCYQLGIKEVRKNIQVIRLLCYQHEKGI